MQCAEELIVFWVERKAIILYQNFQKKMLKNNFRNSANSVEIISLMIQTEETLFQEPKKNLLGK